MSDAFYQTVPIVEEFEALTRPESYRPLPDDWSIVTADVANSTGAIGEGRYKAVNTVGVAVIAAVRNAVRPLELPYVFGGDGALVGFPSARADRVREALAATKAMANDSFDLDLRVAIVPMSVVRSAGHDVRVARYRASEVFVQGAVDGGGAQYAEQALKARTLPIDCLVSADATAQADYSGLECRWKNIPSPSEEIISLIVDATEQSPRSLDVYREVLIEINAIYGDAQNHRPVTEGGLRLAASWSILNTEYRIRTWGGGWIPKLVYRVSLWVEGLLGWWWMRMGLRAASRWELCGDALCTAAGGN